MSKFQKMIKDVVASEKEISVVKTPKQEAPKKEVTKMTNEFKGNKEVEKLLDMMFILKSFKEGLNDSSAREFKDSELKMFERAIVEKTGSTVANIKDIIPSGFSGTFIQDAYEATVFKDVFPFEQINQFGLTDVIGDYAMSAEIVVEYGTPTDTNDAMFSFEYKGGKFMAKTYASYEAVQDASIDYLANKRQGLQRAMAVAIENAIINGKAGDYDLGATALVSANAKDPRNLFSGLRALGNAKQKVDFGGALDEAKFRTGVLSMVDKGGVYTSWQSIDAGDVVLFVPTKVYNAIINFGAFADANKAGLASTLASGRKVQSIFGIPVIASGFIPTNLTVDTAVISATVADNKATTVLLVNTSTIKSFAIKGSAISESARDIEKQSIVQTQSLRLGFGSIFDSNPATSYAVDTTRKNVVAGINIIV